MSLSRGPFRKQADYYVPLLSLLADFPGGQGIVRDVIQEFYARYSDAIPQEHLGAIESNPHEAKWEKHVNFARYWLTREGYLDSPMRSVWRITEQGRAWLRENPSSTHIQGSIPRNSTPSVQRRHLPSASKGKPASLETAAPGITLAMLEQAKQAMDPAAFRQVFGSTYDQVLAAERTKAISDVSDRDLAAAARLQLRQIHDYLAGRNSQMPSSEQLCDWIHFCYQLNLRREAVALFTMVNGDDVNGWYFERTRRIATACRGANHG